MKKIRALITDITGMVGSHLADYLIENTDWDIYDMFRWWKAERIAIIQR